MVSQIIGRISGFCPAPSSCWKQIGENTGAAKQGTVVEQNLKYRNYKQISKFKEGIWKPGQFNPGSSVNTIVTFWADPYHFECLYPLQGFLHCFDFSPLIWINLTWHRLTYFSGFGLKLIWIYRLKLPSLSVLIQSHIQQRRGVSWEENSWFICVS